MLLDKTDKAREALRAGSSAGLGLQDRRILILADGRRSLDAVTALLGPEILPAVDRLLRDGYLARPGAAGTTSADSVRSAMAGLIQAATEAVQARTEQFRGASLAPPGAHPVADAPASPAAPAPAAPQAAAMPRAGGPRRSLPACKMYLLDMLQLQRSAEAAELRTVIQCAAGEAELLEALLQALRLILASSAPGYGARVAQRLAEILPLEALPRLDALRTERPGAPTLSIVA